MPKNLCPEIVIQADIGGMTIAFTEIVTDKTPEEIDERLDHYRRSIGRQRAHQSLVESLVDLRARKEALEQMPDKERAFLKERMDERARMKVQFEAQRQRSGALSVKQEQDLRNFDAQTAAERKRRFEDDRKKIESEIPLFEAQVARQRAIIAGRERSEVIAGEPQAEAAD